MKSMEDVRKFLESLPSDTNIEYTEKINDEVPDYGEEEEKALEAILKNPEMDDELRFKAYYSLMVLYRRYKKWTKMAEITEQCERFSDRPLFLFQKSMVSRRKGEKKEALKLADQAIQAQIQLEGNLGNNRETPRIARPGLYNNYAETAAEILEENINKGTDSENKILLDTANDYIETAIWIDGEYAKYYATRGHLRMIEKKYADARKDINKAIEEEDQSKRDYAIRMMEYQALLNKCDLMEMTEGLKQSLSGEIEDARKITTELRRELANNKIGILEFLGFFTALITFLITTVQISADMVFMERIAAIVVMMGCIIAAFGMLRLIIEPDPGSEGGEWKKIIPFMMIGVLFIAGGIMLARWRWIALLIRYIVGGR